MDFPTAWYFPITTLILVKNFVWFHFPFKVSRKRGAIGLDEGMGMGLVHQKIFGRKIIILVTATAILPKKI